VTPPVESTLPLESTPSREPISPLEPTSLALIDPESADAPAAMAEACEELGFFRVPASAIDASVADAAWETAEQFFALDVSEKRKVEFPEVGYPYGWSPFQFESLGASLGDVEAKADLKESFSGGPDCLGPDWAGRGPEPQSEGERWIRSPSRWPEAIPQLKPSWEAYFGAMSDLSARLLQVMATALELPANYFDGLIDNHTSAMRAIYYRSLDPKTAGLRAGAHSDYGTLTILRTDDTPGLEVRRPDGTWAAVDPVPETYIVNLGDSIQQWTNDRWLSTVHRVTAMSLQPRMSFAFFHMANWDAVIECLPTCTDASNPPHHEPAMAGPWLMSKFQSTVAGSAVNEGPEA